MGILMRPTSSPKRMRKNGFPSQVQELDVRLKDGGCPFGTVPIRRTKKDELTQFNIMNNNLSSSRAQPNSVYRQPGTIFAHAQIDQPGSKAFNGVGAYITVYNPHVRPDEYSSAQITIQDGSDMIEIGWTVNPTMYKDNVTRLFVYSVVKIPLDMDLYPVSVVGGEIYVYLFFVYQDEKNGNWWLELGLNNTIVGFWPQQFFSGMAHSASYVSCGGEVYRPSGSEGQPGMGSGYSSYWHDIKTEAYCQRFVVVNDAHKVVQATRTQEFRNHKDYTIDDNPRTLRPEHYVFFGGPAWAI
ncbi:hypothetical protein V2J09_020251 [Rumex salicifolius]